MAEERTVDQLTTEELFRSAIEPPVQETVPETEPPVKEPEAPPAAAQETPKPEPVAPETPPSESVPPWRLREEADARRLAEERARALEARLNQIQAHLAQQQQANTPKPDFFENPDQATQAIVNRALQPYLEQQRNAQMYMGKMVADMVHGADKVGAAEQAFLKAKDDLSLDPMDYERVVQSPNRYDAVVQWHKRQSVLSSVGDDPKAWFQQELKNQLADPKFQAEILETIKGQAATRPTAVKLPPSLSKATASAGNSKESVGDMSDPSLFAFAMKR